MENSKEGTKDKVIYDEDKELEKAQFVDRLKMILTQKGSLDQYEVFTSADIEALKKQVRRELGGVKTSIEETIKLDDDENKGWVSLEGLKESFEVMELKLS